MYSVMNGLMGYAPRIFELEPSLRLSAVFDYFCLCFPASVLCTVFFYLMCVLDDADRYRVRFFSAFSAFY